MRTITFIFKMARQFPLAITIMFLIAFIWAAEVSLVPYILKIIFDRLSAYPAKDVFRYLTYPSALYLGSRFIFSNAHRIYGYFVEIQMIPLMRKQIVDWAFSILLKHSHQYYQNNFAGSLVNKISDLVSRVPEIIQLMIDQFFAYGLALTIAIYALWQVNIKFALAMLTWAVLFIITLLFCSKKFIRLSSTWSELGSVITGKLVDSLSNILSIRLFARKGEEEAYIDISAEEYLKAEQKLQWSYFWVFITYGYSFIIMQAFNFYFLMKGRFEETISVGDFALVMSINVSIVDFLWRLTKEFAQFAKLWGRISQALQTITIPIEIEDKPEAKKLKIQYGEIIFHHVNFHYKDTDLLFKNKVITIAPGQKVGLVGYSGSGKSTFVNLILRLFEVTSGEILIDGQNIADVTQDSLRQSIGMIPQDPSLFHRTMMENIRYGCIEAIDEEVIEASKRAHAHEFIAKLPLGYDSLVGERGVKVSGGQRQRIAIARAILKNAPILILDEATSQLDSITEGVIQESLWHLMQSKTTIVIAHRLSTLLKMDRILVFDKGQIVEDGTHQELLDQNGMYKTLWDAQVGGFLPDKSDA